MKKAYCFQQYTFDGWAPYFIRFQFHTDKKHLPLLPSTRTGKALTASSDKHTGAVPHCAFRIQSLPGGTGRYRPYNGCMLSPIRASRLSGGYFQEGSSFHTCRRKCRHPWHKIYRHARKADKKRYLPHRCCVYPFR